MPTIPWKTFKKSEPKHHYCALLTYLPLKRYRTIPRFLVYTKKIQDQLSESHGLMGYSLRAHFLKKDFWTLSVWQDLEALHAFAFSGFHRTVMKSLRHEMGPTQFIRWELSGSVVPPSWEEALQRTNKPSPSG